MKTYKNFVKTIAANIKKQIEESSNTHVSRFDRTFNPGLPTNAKGNYYRGVNIFNLLDQTKQAGYKSDQWLTFKKIKELGGSVIKGEKSSIAYFFKPLEQKKVEVEGVEMTDMQSPTMVYREYRVFNLAQTSLISDDIEPPIHSDILRFVDKVGVHINHMDIAKAYYMSCRDVICLPLASSFKSEDDYLATLCHEIAHWTGHKTRLNRDSVKNYGKDIKIRALEELVAEISSASLMSYFGIKGTMENHASYIESWMTVLTDDDFERAVIEAGKVLNLILDADSYQEENVA